MTIRDQRSRTARNNPAKNLLRKFWRVMAAIVLIWLLAAGLFTWVFISAFEHACRTPDSEFERDVCGYFAKSEDPS